MSSLYRNGCSLAYPWCRSAFRAVALCLAKIEPFYWPPDSSSTEIRLLDVLLSVFSSQMQDLSKGLCGSLCRNGCGLAYPRCGRGFRAVALSLVKIEPFYWLSDSSSTEIRLLAVLLAVFSSQMPDLSQGL